MYKSKNTTYNINVFKKEYTNKFKEVFMKRIYRGFRANKEYQNMINYIRKHTFEIDRAKVIRNAIEELYEELKNDKKYNF